MPTYLDWVVVRKLKVQAVSLSFIKRVLIQHLNIHLPMHQGVILDEVNAYVVVVSSEMLISPKKKL